MCDEYDEERMRAFWRMLSERNGLTRLDVVDSEGEVRTDVPPLPEPVSPTRPRAMALRH